MLWTIIIILLVLWLLGAFGGKISPRLPKSGSWIHILIVIVIILVVLNLLGVV
ncbi:MAG: lmo0937 family membrane protein [Anaerolineales bacterium]|nr:lmo0937 family membrane protein [Anaerolineales bacterium]